MAEPVTHSADVTDPVAATQQAATAQQAPMLHPGKPFVVDVIFQRSYRGKVMDAWPDSAIKDVCEAARHLQEIWSSQEFQSALSSVPELILEADKEGRVLRRISGRELLERMLSKPRILLTVAITFSRFTAWQCGVSSFPPDETALQGHYIVDLKYGCGEPPLLPSLTNKLGHEYTHYEWIGSTDEGKYAAYNARYVSYGVGCLTQNIGFPANTCKYSPVPVADKPHSE